MNDLIYINTDNISNIINTYKQPNKRVLCHLQKGNSTDPHCKCINKKCKLLINKTNLIDGKDNIKTYISKVSDELVRIYIKGHEILQNDISNVIDKSIITPYQNEIIYNAPEDVLNIYKHHIKYHSYILNNINYTNTENVNFNKNKYKLINYVNKSTNIIKKELLSNHWKKILKDDYNNIISVEYKYSTLYSLFGLLLYLFKSDVSIDSIKQQIINKLDSSNNISNLKKLYQNELLQFKNIKNKNIKNEITKDNYDGSIIDLPLLAIYLNINIIIIHSRITKANPKAFNIFLSNHGNNSKYLLLYAYKKKNEKNKSFSIIEINKSKDILIDKNNIPINIKNYIFGNNSKTNNSKSNNS